ncbi:MAG: S8 family serine peptidase [Fulvivirga sp.]
MKEISEYTYKVNGQTIQLELDDENMGVRFKAPSTRSSRATLSNAIEGFRSFSERIELPKEMFTILKMERGVQPSEVGRTLDQVDEVANVAPVFKIGSKRVVATDRVFIGLSDVAKKIEIVGNLDGQILEEDGLELLVKLPEGIDPFQIIQQLDQNKDIEYAEPDFVIMGMYLPRVTNSIRISNLSSYTQFQYALDITKTRQAWKNQLGDEKVKIAILDEGVDTLHEDLKNAIVGSYDGTDNDSFQEPHSGDAHGTACAGLAAAVRNSLGISGVGAGCSLLAVRIAFSNNKGEWVTSNSCIARAIDWSWRNGADILSNSWGGGAPSRKIINAFERARTLGRDSKGCIIVIAAGNDSRPVDFPGNLKEILTVSASNEYDEPKTWSSADGETWWGSNFGDAVDVSAPGVHNYSTDISGIDGYNDGSRGVDKNYVDNFNGTSSSTPIVAGCAGLILSANPDLTEAQVRKIIVSNTDKVGQVNYDANGHNVQMGYGRLNVLKSVLAAKKRLSETP